MTATDARLGRDLVFDVLGTGKSRAKQLYDMYAEAVTVYAPGSMPNGIFTLHYIRRSRNEKNSPGSRFWHLRRLQPHTRAKRADGLLRFSVSKASLCLGDLPCLDGQEPVYGLDRIAAGITSVSHLGSAP
jgi:hypothetical protein